METSFISEMVCPQCRTRISKSIALSVCIVCHKCPGCSMVIRPRPGEGCVFSSYGNAAAFLDKSNLVRCLPDHGERFHVVVGTSPFNSYYSENRLAELLVWANGHFDLVGVFVPDTPTAWTLEAGGYSPDEASYKTKRQLRYLNNKIGRAREVVDNVSNRISLIPWSLVAQHDNYVAAEGRCRTAFATDSEFQRECLAATDEVLENRRRDGHHLSDQDRLRAVNYLMAELPLILFGPELFGVQTSTFVYHRSLRLLERLFAGEFSIGPMPGQHFVIAHELAERVSSPSRDAA
ncbi:tRNA-dependent cyclodipeptide synthase [Cyanobium sp. A2C-AMD]|uniref:tRNA-dependent cyclodipeptide synthase n=2 Tax=Cyanobium TaxID=167375 RepID=UPI0028F3F360|nr:tRNA-dependent cyclodipeptide synthase [Cyanobium sp. A2C-AMD]